MLAAIKLRHDMPNLPRPYRMPCEFGALVAFLAFPICFAACVCVNELTKSYAALAVNCAFLLGGVLAYVNGPDNRRTARCSQWGLCCVLRSSNGQHSV